MFVLRCLTFLGLLCGLDQALLLCLASLTPFLGHAVIDFAPKNMGMWNVEPAKNGEDLYSNPRKDGKWKRDLPPFLT